MQIPRTCRYCTFKFLNAATEPVDELVPSLIHPRNLSLNLRRYSVLNTLHGLAGVVADLSHSRQMSLNPP